MGPRLGQGSLGCRGLVGPLVQADPLGNVVSACYGPAPFSHGPRQAAKDGEDYAVYMLVQCAMAPIDLYCDCQ
eukprot:2256204-Pyramimonas_sp.AAC.1